ncbi:MAG: tetratricopeptide repeat protein [bacterium]|nr:tetratricopeptide repeat protein [bacterium]
MYKRYSLKIKSDKRLLIVQLVLIAIMTIHDYPYCTAEANAGKSYMFLVVNPVDTSEEKVPEITPKTVDPRYAVLEKMLTKAGVDTGNSRYLGLNGKLIFKESAIRNKAVEQFLRYALSLPDMKEAAQALYYAAIITDEIVRQELTITRLEADNGQNRHKAIELYKLMTERYPRYKDMDAVIYRYILMLFDYGDITQAGPLIDRFLKFYLQSEFRQAVIYYQGRLALEQGNPGQAYRLLTAVEKGNYTDNIAISYYTARSLYEIGKLSNWQPESMRQLDTLSQALLEVTRTDNRYRADALSIYKDACRLQAEAQYPENDLNSLLSRRKVLQKLQADNGKIVSPEAVNSLVDELSLKIAQEYRRLGDSTFRPQARREDLFTTYRYYAKALEEYPQISEADYITYRIGQCFLGMHRGNDAVNSFKRVITDHPQSTLVEEVRYTLGMVLGSVMKRYLSGIEELEALANNYPYSKYAPEALFQAGTYYQNIGDYDGAIRSFTRLARNYRESPRAKWALDLAEKVAVEKENELNNRRAEK